MVVCAFVSRKPPKSGFLASMLNYNVYTIRIYHECEGRSEKSVPRIAVCFCGRVPWLYQYWPGGLMLFVVLCPGTPEGSTGSGSGFKASQKTGQRLKVSSDRLGEAGNRTCDPWFTRHRFIPYTTAPFGLAVPIFRRLCQPSVLICLSNIRKVNRVYLPASPQCLIDVI